MDTQLIARALHHYYTDPDQRTITHWIDGDKASFAGRIVLEAGAVPTHGEGWPDNGAAVIHDGKRHYVPELACALTGITPCEGRWLFYRARHLDEISQAVMDVLDNRAIDGRPYWTFPDTDYRWMNTEGSITVACHRRTVFYRIARHWQTLNFPQPHYAQQHAHRVARDTGAHQFQSTTTYTHRSI